MAVRGLDVSVECVEARHVLEGGRVRDDDGPAVCLHACQHDYLGQLRPGDIRAGAELEAGGAARVPAHQFQLISGLDVLVEWVIGWHVHEGWRGWSVEREAVAKHHYLG